MPKYLTSLCFITAVLLSLNFLSCKKEEVKNYSKYPLDLQIEPLTNGGYKYTWNPVNTSDFKEYWLIRNQSDSVAFIDENIPEALIRNGNILITKITDANQTTFTDSVSLFAGKNFIRVFAFLENRALSSPNKEIKGLDNLIQIKGNADKMIFDKNNSVFYFIDASLGQISTVAATSYNVLSSSFITTDVSKEIYFYDFGASSQLYVPPLGNGSFTFINLPNLNQRGITNVGVDTKSLVICKDKFLVFSSSQILSSKNKNDLFLSSISSIFIPIVQSTQPNLLRWLNSQNQVWLFSFANSVSSIHAIPISDNGLLLSGTRALSLKIASKSSISTPFVIAPRELFAVIDNQGIVIDVPTFRQLFTLSSKTNFANVKYKDFTFSTDEKFMYALREGELPNDKKIDVFTYPDFGYIKSIAFKSNPQRFFYHENKLKLIGTVPQITNFTLFEILNP
jgi:hypothetical protein